jgi:putative Mg2+ transporter-C (MgtC) family protein
MADDSVVSAIDMLTRVGLATVLGLAIGLERQWRSRLAGLQTMALVSMGSALFLILGAYSFGQETAPTRVAAQIVSGIGFLGAGVIMKQGLSVTGLNTAATLWATGAVGALAGAWMWREATTGAVIILATNGFLHPLAGAMDRRRFRFGRETPSADYVFEAGCKAEAESAIRALLVQALTHPGMQLTSLRSLPAKDPEEVQLRAELTAAARNDAPLEDAVGTLSLDPRVVSARWTVAQERAANWSG